MTEPTKPHMPPVNIGKRPAPPCKHDFVFLRRESLHPEIGGGIKIDTPVGSVDVFYCRYCLEQREVRK